MEFDDKNSNFGGSDQGASLPKGGRTLELGSFDSTLEAEPVRQPESSRAGTPQGLSGPGSSGNSLELALVDDQPAYHRTMTAPPEPEPEEPAAEAAPAEAPAVLASDQQTKGLGIEARALHSGAYSGPIVARRQSVSLVDKIRDNFVVMTIAGALMGLLIGAGVAHYYTSAALQGEVKSYASKKEVAKKGAVLLQDSQQIDEYAKKEASARKSIALKSSLMWGGIFALFLAAWIKFVA